MSIEALIFGGLAVCLLMGIPIFIALGVATVLVMILKTQIPLMTVAQVMYTGSDNFPLLSLPCFILAGTLMEHGGVTQHIIDIIKNLMGRVTGGLGVTTILACMFFSCVSGSGPGTTAAVGALMIPAMLRQNYDRGYAGAVASSGGTLGILIPPSNPMIIYGVIANCSIAALFMAGFLPGLLIGSAHCLVAYLVARRMKFQGIQERFNFKGFLLLCWRGKFSLAAPLVILGGIYTGAFTPVEASVVAVVYAFLVGMFINKKLNAKNLLQAMSQTNYVTGSLIIIIATSTLFGRVLTMYDVPNRVADSITQVSKDWFIVLLMIIGVLVIIGTFMETLSTIIILTPILLPLVTRLGVDPIHFGIIFVITNEVAFLTPPVGVNLFVACKMANVSLERLSWHVLPHIIAILLCLVVITKYSWISLVLPRLFGLY